MPSLLTALATYPFLQHAVLAGLVASVLCGVIGTFVVVKRLTFLADGISHAAFGGMGVCFYFGVDPLLGAVAVALVAALLLGWVDSERVRSSDALIGVIWAVGLAVGIVFVDRTPGYAPNLMAYLFGNILLVSRHDLAVTLALSAGIVMLLALFWKGLVAVAFDDVFARLQGLPVRALLTLLLSLIALSVVLLIQLVGIILVVALLTIPPIASLMLWKDLRAVIAGSVAIGVAVTLGGLTLSYYYDLPSGPAVVLLGAVVLFAVYGLKGLLRRRVS